MAWGQLPRETTGCTLALASQSFRLPANAPPLACCRYLDDGRHVKPAVVQQVRLRTLATSPPPSPLDRPSPHAAPPPRQVLALFGKHYCRDLDAISPSAPSTFLLAAEQRARDGSRK